MEHEILNKDIQILNVMKYLLLVLFLILDFKDKFFSHSNTAEELKSSVKDNVVELKAIACQRKDHSTDVTKEPTSKHPK